MPPIKSGSYASIRRSERLARKAAYFEQSFSVPSLNGDDVVASESLKLIENKVRLRRASTTANFYSMDAQENPRDSFKRRSVRQSIRRSFQPFTSLLSSNRRRKTEKFEPVYENPETMNARRTYRNTACVSTPDLNPPPSSEKLRIPEFRVPQPPKMKILPEAPRPMPRTSLLRQENVPPLPPRRRTTSFFDNPLDEPLKELEKLEPTRVIKALQEIPVNSPKRKICTEPPSEAIADDETSFVDWDSDKKRRRTVRFQESSLWLLRGSNESTTGKAKLQLSLYVNCGHISVHVIRGANLPLLPDQHELNSYIKVSMEPKDCRVQHRSQLVSGTVDPCYDFRLSFELPPEQGEDDSSLLLTVWHRDTRTRQSRLLGFLNFTVSKIIEANRIDGWFRLPSLAITKKTHS